MVMLASGCGKKADFSAKPKPATKPPETRSVATQGGTITRRDPAKGEALWTVKWEGAKLDFTDEKRFGGQMFGVSGTMYDKGEPVTDFRAEQAIASKEDETLALSGKVELVSRTQGAKLTCGSVRYLGIEARIDAQDDVRVENKIYTMGPFAKVSTNPDLTFIATPEMFNAK